MKKTVEYVELSDPESDDEIQEHVNKAAKIVHKYNSLKEELASSSVSTDQCECSDMDDESEEEDEPTTSDEEFIASDSEVSTVVLPEMNSNCNCTSPPRIVRQVACTTPPTQLAPTRPPSIMKARFEARQAEIEQRQESIREQWFILQGLRKSKAIHKNWRFYADVFVDSIPGETRELRMKLLKAYMMQQLKEL